MSDKTGIEWTDATWNPVTGCSKISPGCRMCYAERMAKRLQAMGQANYANGFKLTLHPHMLDKPLHWKRPRYIFVNSMSDLFHKDVPDGFIYEVVSVMQQAHWHTFQVLTKRAERLAEMSITWPPNVQVGMSIETHDYIYRADLLCDVDAKVRFLSLEPLLGPLDNLNLNGIHWVIVGGESGPHSRPMRKEWVTSIRDQCLAHQVPFFFKQWGGNHKINGTWGGNELDGRIWNERP